MKTNFTNIFVVSIITLIVYSLAQSYIRQIDNPSKSQIHVVKISDNTWTNTAIWTTVPAPVPVTPPPAPMAINSFLANGTEPFWAANFSWTTMVLQNPDIGIVNITGIVWPIILTGWIYIRNEPLTSTLINLTIQPCTNGMSEQIFSGSIVISISGAVYNWCAMF